MGEYVKKKNTAQFIYLVSWTFHGSGNYCTFKQLTFENRKSTLRFLKEKRYNY